jgi:RNA polymerase sigma-B factor
MTQSCRPRAAKPVGYEYLDSLLVEFAALDIGDPRFGVLRAELIVGYRPILMHLAARYSTRGSAEDLEQVAVVGLINALDRFDPSRGVDFVHFLIPTATGEILRYFRDRTWSMRPPRRLSDLQGAINRAQDTLTQTLGRAPRPGEIAESVGVAVEDVVEALQAAQACRAVSLDRVLEVSMMTLGEKLGRVDTALDLVEDREALRVVLRRISERDRRILVLRFVAGMTQAEIGEAVGLSQMSVSRMLTKTLARLRFKLESPPLAPTPRATGD